MAAEPPRILVIEDDRRTAGLVELYLREGGFEPLLAHDGEQGLHVFRSARPDLVVLDLMLPARDGWSVCRALRAESDVPILILSARQEEDDRLVGLGLGADDYVVKPFSPREVVLRIRAILRRARRTAAGPPPPRGGQGPIRIDRERRCAFSYDREVALTPSEFKLLDALCRAPGRTFERSELLDRLYPSGGSVVNKVVDVHIAKLRQKVEPVPSRPRHILTVRGFGYRFQREA